MSEHVRSVDHALRILELLMEHGEMRVSEIARAVGVAPSTSHRILSTMVARGFAAQGPNRRYRLGPHLASKARQGSQLAALVSRTRPALRATFEQVRETVHLMVLLGSDVQFIDGIEGPHALRVGMRIGARIPAYCTSGGKAILATMEPSMVDALHPRGLPPWPTSRIRSLEHLHAALAEVRTAGVAINEGESEAGVVAVGAALASIDAPFPAAIAVALPAERYNEANQTNIIAALLSAAGQTGGEAEG